MVTVLATQERQGEEDDGQQKNAFHDNASRIKPATMVVRRGPDGRALREGAQVQIGGNETYVSLCRRHWREEVGDQAAP